MISTTSDFHPGDFVYIGLERIYGIVTGIEESYVAVKRQYGMASIRIGLFKPEWLKRVQPEGELIGLFEHLKNSDATQ
jgi:hypothetical protein